MKKMTIVTLAALNLMSKARAKKETDTATVSPTETNVKPESIAGFRARMQDKSEQITITVSGPECAGKSALLGIIEDLLKEKGITVKHEDPEQAALERKWRTTSDHNVQWDSDLRMYKPIVTLCELLTHKG